MSFLPSSLRRTFAGAKLDRVVILIDELYVEEQFGKTLQNPKNAEMYKQSKCCWISIVDAGQRTFDHVEELLKCMSPSKFKLQKLNVVYRNATHICKISHSFIDRLSPVNGTSLKVHGCFVSSQKAIEVKAFEDIKEVIASKEFSEMYKTDRIVILLRETDIDERTCEKIKACHTTNGKVFQSIVGLWDENQFRFTGIDAKSVLIIIDLNAIYPRSIYLINLAVNRAQYAVGVFIQKKLTTNQVWVDYCDQRKPKRLEIYKDLLNGKLSEKRNSALKPRRLLDGDVDDLQDQLKDENVAKLIDIGDWKVCFQRVFLFDNVKLINDFIRKLKSATPFLEAHEGKSLSLFITLANQLKMRSSKHQYCIVSWILRGIFTQSQILGKGPPIFLKDPHPRNL